MSCTPEILRIAILAYHKVELTEEILLGFFDDIILYYTFDIPTSDIYYTYISYDNNTNNDHNIKTRYIRGPFNSFELNRYFDISGFVIT